VAGLPVPRPLLADGVVVLRVWRESDVPALVAGFADPLVHRFSWPGTEPYREADARRYLADQEEGRRHGEQAEFALVAPGDDARVLGGASLYAVDLPEGRASVGYWLVAGARGRGFAARAVRLLARWAFDDLGVARLELTCGPDNLASQRVAERCGFTREAVLRSHLAFKGRRRDTVVFGLLPGELR
jgi:RimJ/RimL family protein N-acetyltransferase